MATVTELPINEIVEGWPSCDFTRGVFCYQVAFVTQSHKIVNIIRCYVIAIECAVRLYVVDIQFLPNIVTCFPTFLACMTISFAGFLPLNIPIRTAIGAMPAQPRRTICASDGIGEASFAAHRPVAANNTRLPSLNRFIAHNTVHSTTILSRLPSTDQRTVAAACDPPVRGMLKWTIAHFAYSSFCTQTTRTLHRTVTAITRDLRRRQIEFCATLRTNTIFTLHLSCISTVSRAKVFLMSFSQCLGTCLAIHNKKITDMWSYVK